MHITYLLATGSNAVYDGKYSHSGRYHTYGQQSFVLDLIRTMSRAGHTVRLNVDTLSSLALASTFRDTDSVTVTEEIDPSGKTDLILVDEVPDEMLMQFDEHVPAFRIVHHAGRRSSDYLVSRCSRFLCMTENALSLQRRHLPADRAVLVHQGVDLERFPAVLAKSGGRRPRVLLYCRLDSGREALLGQIIENIDRDEVLVYVVGEGPGFWDMSDRFGSEIILINHIPCQSIPNLLGEMDVVISLGRGAMEAMATGIPTLCAGHHYAGPITADNMASLMRYNLTGAVSDRDPSLVMTDIREALNRDRREVRALAEERLSADAFLEGVSDLYAQIAA
ncbi:MULTISPECIES: hypothetical protein [Streptomyces]|uniref:Glycosyltransferase n=2 Tax=Streptomyces griseoaurantiacus TaxID=68213 RepID=F3NK31_9ACTN|nr:MULTISPECIES: hypothetical protein [Streptomyces]EGG46442.1 hypothetical protein SGM_3495 [Streptomyces griseoaurantiacus M045]WTI30121.1 hypothetical protein OHA67_29245 [Streptomyces jietaisiensis]